MTLFWSAEEKIPKSTVRSLRLNGHTSLMFKRRSVGRAVTFVLADVRLAVLCVNQMTSFMARMVMIH